MPLSSIKQRILEINELQSTAYVADESARLRYWAVHKTFFACIKCMDGRVNFPLMTKTPIGIVKPFRAIGGKFDVWWPSFLGRVRHWTEVAINHGSRTFLFVTYHYSASDTHLGCAGWKYDKVAARQHAEKLRQDLSFIFSEELTAVVAGVETDRDILTLHGEKDDVSGEMLIGKTKQEISAILLACFPNVPAQVREDLIPFLLGNAQRVDELTREPRNHQQKQHNERIVAVGQGFDWLTQENLALIINDSDPNLAESIRVAGSLIVKNLKDAPPDDDAAICTNVSYKKPGLDERQAIARAKGLREFTKQVIQESYPELVVSGRLHAFASVMWEPSKKIRIIEE